MPLGLAALHVSRAIAAERVCPSPTTFKQAGHRLWRLCPAEKTPGFRLRSLAGNPKGSQISPTSLYLYKSLAGCRNCAKPCTCCDS